MTIATQDSSGLEERLQAWAEAERAGDVSALNELAVENFILVGPLGFMLDREQWLDRFREGDLVISSLAWSQSRTRTFGDAAVVVGVQDQEAAYHGQPNNGQFRVTQVWVRAAGSWDLASLHFSPITAPPGAGTGPSRGRP